MYGIKQVYRLHVRLATGPGGLKPTWILAPVAVRFSGRYSPAAITETSTEADKSYYKAWERSNRLSLNLIKMTMAENVKPPMPKMDNAREYMLKIKEYSQSDITDKSIVGILMSELMTKKFNWLQPIHDHVTGMQNLAAMLKSMSMNIDLGY
uniref:Uncharacterized protein n=1 Tax=Manihot esculenta TaxID=3983 RepID=A0A2C9V4Z2_MANES